MLPVAAAAGADQPDLVALCEKVKPAFVFIGGGSGVVISRDGTLLTNAHVIGDAKTFDVRLGDRRHFRAELLGRDVQGDLAVLKLDLKPDEKVPHLDLGDSESMRVGDYVLAIGNPFGEGLVDQYPTFTFGVISGLNHVQGQYTDSIITDAAVNPGNSGGPLCNMAGQVIGINGQIESRWGLRSNTGLGFAISSRRIQIWLPRLAQAHGGEVKHGQLPGLVFEPSEAGVPQRAMIQQVVGGSPAAESGFAPGDAVVEFEGKPAALVSQLRGLVGIYPEDHEVNVTVQRNDKQVQLNVKLVRAKPGFLGLKFAKPGKPDKYVKIEEVAKDSPAAGAGLRQGDEIVELGGAALSMPVETQYKLLDLWLKKGVFSFQPVAIKVRRKKDGDSYDEHEFQLVPK
jgi:S1-C subfamily serine protease